MLAHDHEQSGQGGRKDTDFEGAKTNSIQINKYWVSVIITGWLSIRQKLNNTIAGDLIVEW